MNYLLLFNILLTIAIICSNYRNCLSANKYENKDILHLKKKNNYDTFFYIFVILLIFISTFKDGNSFYDNEEYVDSIKYGSERFEISWEYICQFWAFCGFPKTGVFLTYATIGILTKCYVIKKTYKWYWLCMAVYLSHFYLLQDCVQIRVGAASGCLLLAMYYWCNKKKTHWLLLTLLSSFLQYSFVIGFLVPFIDKIPLASRIWRYVLIGAYIFYFLSLDVSFVFSYIGLDIFSNYYSHYLLTDKKVEVLNMTQIAFTVISLYLLSLKRFRASLDCFSSISLKLFILSLCFLPLLANIPVFAYRGSQIFGIVEIFVIPILMSIKNQIQYLWVLIVFMYYTLNTQILRCIIL